MQLQILEGDDSQVSIVARCDDPMLLPISSYSKCNQVIDQTAVEAQDHVWINLIDLVLIVSNDIVEAAV